jgi:microcystin-dependent protein
MFETRLARNIAALSLAAAVAEAQTAANPSARVAAAAVKPESLRDGTYVGEIRAFAGELCPDGWVQADGKEYSQAQYPKLDAVIGDLWGSSAINMFNVPDLRGITLRGWNGARTGKYADPDIDDRELMPGAPGHPNGDKNHVGTYQLDQVQTHSHNDAGHSHALAGIGYRDHFGCGPHCGALTGGGGTATTASNANITEPASHGGTDIRHGEETRAKNAYVLFCIRAPRAQGGPGGGNQD